MGCCLWRSLAILHGSNLFALTAAACQYQAIEGKWLTFLRKCLREGDDRLEYGMEIRRGWCASSLATLARTCLLVNRYLVGGSSRVETPGINPVAEAIQAAR